MTESPEPQSPQERVRRWLEDAVIGLNLCPFARPVFTRKQIHLALVEETSFDKVILATLIEIDRLLDHAPDEIATTLVVCLNALSDFDEFLEAIEIVQALLSQAGADGILQVAHFHPDYQFEGTEPDALENFTNRAPYPIIHLLREAQMSEAVDSHPDPESIPQKNIAKLEELGRERIDEMWAGWSDKS